MNDFDFLGEYSKYHLYSTKTGMAHVCILLFKDKSIKNGAMVIKMLLDTLSDLDKLNNGEYSKYHLFSTKTDMANFKDKSI